MFDIGFQELVVIFVIALLVFGPERLPEISKTLGKWVIEIRRGLHNAKVQMDSEFDAIKQETRPPEATPDNEVKKDEPVSGEGTPPEKEKEG